MHVTTSLCFVSGSSPGSGRMHVNTTKNVFTHNLNDVIEDTSQRNNN